MKRSKRIALFTRVSNFILIILLALTCGVATGEEKKKDKQQSDEFTLEEITVTAQFQETNLQKTPIAITAVTGDMLEDQNILSVKDLGLIVPNASIREQGNAMGPNAQIGLRGVGQYDFIPAFEPGVGVYVDDIYNETLVGSTLDLVDLERIEVLRGPQGTLFGKNSLGGAIRLISKLPRGDNTGHVAVTGGTYNRLDFSGSYDFALIEDLLFARISASSKKIDGYMDRLDYTCQMIANGTPEKAGSLPSTLRNDRMAAGDCKIGEKGGSQSDAAKIMLRYIPTTELEFNFGFDYSDAEMDPGAETLLSDKNPNSLYDSYVQTNIIDPTWNTNPGDALSILNNDMVTDSYYTVYESFLDPFRGERYPDKNTEDHTNMFARIDYDITDDIHLKGIFGYREYQQIFSTANGTPFSFNAYYIDMEHDQTSYELRLNGTLLNKRLEWTTGGYYFESNHHYGGHVNYGTYGLYLEDMGRVGPFDNNDSFTTESTSFFAHTIFAVTEKLSFTTGGRYTDENKTFSFDHGNFLYLPIPLTYGQSHYDWKLSFDYQFTEDIMAYVMASTGYRSEGANPRPYTQAQLEEITGEKILAYEIGTKASFFDNRLRINAAAFQNDYDPRQFMTLGAQCTAVDDLDHGEYIVPYGSSVCPEGTAQAGSNGTYAMVYISAPGTSRGFELDVMAMPINNFNINASFGYFDYETDVSEGDLGYIHPDYKMQPEYTYNIGTQYRINFDNGSVLIPRLDMFYQGERNNNGIASKPIAPYHVVPDYHVFNARLTYMPPDVKWSVSFEVKNLFDKFYWISLGSERSDDLSQPTYTRVGTPSPPRMVALTFRYNLF